MPHNRALQAPNVFELDCPVDALADAAEFFERFVASEIEGHDDQGYARGEYAFFVRRPPGDEGSGSDIRWISPDDERTFEFFQRLFERFDLAEVAAYIPHTDEVRLYSAFIVTRSQCHTPYFHSDYSPSCGTKAYTLLTPLADYSALEDGHLLYYTLDGEATQYTYRYGKAVAFGAGFVHATQHLRRPSRRSFLCFTFGTDEEKAWPTIEASVGYQSRLVHDPRGRAFTRPMYTGNPGGSSAFHRAR